MKKQYVIVCENKNEYPMVTKWLKEFDCAEFLSGVQPDTEKYEGVICVFDKHPTDSCDSINSWAGHSHLACVWGETLAEKKAHFVKVVCHTLGIPAPLETERKFLIKMPDISYLENLPASKSVSICQCYLDIPGKNVRIRKRNSIYIKTEKSNMTGITRTEEESLISENEYNDLMEYIHKGLAPVSKTRYCLLYEGRYFEIDVFPFWDDVAYLEIELIDENEQFEIPPFIEVIKEVTFDREYTNKSIAKRIKNNTLDELKNRE